MTAKSVQFWFEFASTYSYLSIMRIEERAAEAGFEIDWKPFPLGPIFKAQGWDNSPFNIYKAKGDYMWRDMERLCAHRNLPFVTPDPFPQNSLSAARLALAAQDEPWFVDYCKGVYAAQFGAGKNIADPDTLSEIVLRAGADPAHWLSRMGEDDVKQALKTRSAEAMELGIFGAPSFIVDGELYWGDDRLDQALGAGG
ncbi:MAG: 2-hydroxychromene-2-carboxylate isomerase [Hyphomicrobiales bacterium]